MQHRKANGDKQQAEKNLRQIDDTYVFDEASGLYQPKTVSEKNKSKKRSYRSFGVLPIKVERDWVVLIVSVLTLMVVGAYTEFAKRQWIEMQRATKASTDAANTAACALEENRKEFSTTFEQSRKQLQDFEKSQGAILRAAVTISSDYTKATLSLRNVGHSAAIKIAMHSDAIYTPFVGTEPDPEKVKEYLTPLPIDENGSVLGEGEEHSPEMGIGLPSVDEQASETRRGMTRVVFLNVSYQDIFGHVRSVSDCVFNGVMMGGKFVRFKPCPNTTKPK